MLVFVDLSRVHIILHGLNHCFNIFTGKYFPGGDAILDEIRVPGTFDLGKMINYSAVNVVFGRSIFLRIKE